MPAVAQSRDRRNATKDPEDERLSCLYEWRRREGKKGCITATFAGMIRARHGLEREKGKGVKLLVRIL